MSTTLFTTSLRGITDQCIFVLGRSVRAILALSLVTAIGLYLDLRAITVSFLFFTCVLIQARRADFWSSATAATVAAFALAFFFTPPNFSFGIAKPQDAIAVLTFVIIAFVIAHLSVARRVGLKSSNETDLDSANPGGRRKTLAETEHSILTLIGHGTNILIMSAILLMAYGLAWTYATHRYLKGFADAIVPLEGPPLEKSQALLSWLRHEPERIDSTLNGQTSLRNPVNIVQNTRLLKYCGSAANAFMNLAEVSGVKTRRLLLLDGAGNTKHVVAEVESEGRWVVVDPSLGLVFRNRSGNGLTKEQLRDVKMFKEAISRMPGYKSNYTFEHTAHTHLKRIPVVGDALRRALDNLDPGWEEEVNWGYFPENPSLWPIIASVPLLLLGIFIRSLVSIYGSAGRPGKTIQFREQQMKTGTIARV